jgi:hypothetical protein
MDEANEIDLSQRDPPELSFYEQMILRRTGTPAGIQYRCSHSVGMRNAIMRNDLAT